MTTKRLLAFLLACFMVLSLAACEPAPAPTDPPTDPPTAPPTEPPTDPPTEPPTDPPPTPAEVYDAAVQLLDAVASLTQKIKMNRTLEIRGETFVEATSMTLALKDRGTESMTAALSEKSDSEGYETSYSEIFKDGVLYTTVDKNYNFKGTMTAEEFISRFAPAELLDPALYGSITQDGNIIHFAEPTAGESWIMPEFGTLVSASGTAELTEDGTIAGYTYTLTYTVGGSTITWDISTTLNTTKAVVGEPKADNLYTELEFVDAPRVIEQAAALLFQCYDGHSVTASTMESIMSQAAGVIRNQQTVINTWGSGTNYKGEVKTSIYMATPQWTDSLDQREHFENGKYTIAEGDEKLAPGGSVSASQYQNYCVNAITGGLPPLDLLEGAVIEDLGSVYYLELTYEEALATGMKETICKMLWEDGKFLDDLASAYVTNNMDVYLSIDKITGLPTALGYHYEGCHTIDGNDYTLSMQTDQSFDLSSEYAYKNITEEVLTPEEPDEKATPLFYHVTGPDGQEMWLLGTIHVGDERTSYLPQEIYDAFDASDALAVEFNSEAFNDQVEEDDELSEKLSNMYFYSDGTTTEDHVEDPEVYEMAKKLMKASGNYSMNAPYMKAYLWSNSIENFVRDLARDISGLHGVDNQLIWRAQDQGKTILEVESGLFQTEMVTSFSDALQEQLLAESLMTDPVSYMESVRELFELWCSGDEAALIAYLNSDSELDTSELTEEELALIEEYNNAMGPDRNDDMLTVAIGYLESGDVVFYAVGLAHLLAEDGLVNTLRDAGYTVELVTFE